MSVFCMIYYLALTLASSFSHSSCINAHTRYDSSESFWFSSNKSVASISLGYRRGTHSCPTYAMSTGGALLRIVGESTATTLNYLYV